MGFSIYLSTPGRGFLPLFLTPLFGNAEISKQG
jgi:hypothetical protein